MLYFCYKGFDLLLVTDKFDEKPEGTYAESRSGWNNILQARSAARDANVLEDTDAYLAVDKGYGCYPQFDVVKAPSVGDPVSYGFNGDCYPDGEVSYVSPSKRQVTTSSGRKYRRRKETGSWVSSPGGTWSLVPGHISKRNPSF